jgi:hypothetical protein
MILAADHARQRKAPASDFTTVTDQFNAEMLHREPFTRAPEARLDFIGNQQNAMLVAKLAQPYHPWVLRKSAFALHRLDDDGGNPLAPSHLSNISMAR